MIHKTRAKGLFATLLSVLLVFFLAQGSVSAASCKGLSKSKCGGNSSCSWVGGYTTKKGVKVSAFCRNKPGSGTSKAKKKSVAKKSATKKKTSSKSSQKKDKAAKERARNNFDNLKTSLLWNSNIIPQF